MAAQRPLTTAPLPRTRRRPAIRLGHEPDLPGSEEAIDAVEALADPLDRYARATEEQGRYEQAARRAGQIRALAALAIHELGASYGTIAHVTGLTRSRAQQLVEAGRRLRADRPETAA